MDFAMLVFFMAAGGFTCGYAFRGFIGKEVKAFATELKTEYQKAVAELKKI